MLLCSRGVSRSGALCSSTLPAALRLISSKDIDVDALNQELDDVFGVQHASVVQHQWDGAPLPQRPPAVNKSSAARQAPSAQSTPPYQQARLSHDQSSTTSWSTTPHAQPLGSQPPLDQMVSGLSQQLAELRSHLAAVHTQLTQVRQQPPPPLQQHDTQHQYTPHASQAGPASCSAPSSPTDSASSPMDSTSWDDDSSNSSSSGYHQRHQDRPTGSLTHVDGSGRASMVDVSGKSGTTREARASCRVLLGPEAFDLVQSNSLSKGDVLTVAQLAGIMGAKHTALLIPLCHTLLLSKVDVNLSLEGPSHSVAVRSMARTVGQTGVEMEALTAAAVAGLTVYDMCKAVAKDARITDLRLDFKSGGKSGTFSRDEGEGP